MKRYALFLFVFVLVVPTFSKAQEPKLVVPTGQLMSRIEFSPSGEYAATASGSQDNHDVKLWGVSSGKELKTLVGHSSAVTYMAFSPNGDYILTGSLMDRTARLWDVRSGEQLKVFVNVASCALSPDGRYVAIGNSSYGNDGKIYYTGNYDHPITVWDARSRNQILVLHGHQRDVTGVSFSPDGKYILSDSRDDGTMRLWEASSGNLLRAWNGVTYAAFSGNGKYMLTVSNNIAQLWDVPPVKEIRRFSNVDGAAISPDGKYILVAGNNSVALWDVNQNTTVKSFRNTCGATFSPT